MFLFKTLVSALLIAGASETAKRSSMLGAVIVSLPLTSILAMIWLYRDTKDTAVVAAYSTSIFWAVLVSLPMFLVLPWLLKRGLGFAPSLTLSSLVAFLGYCGYLAAAPRL